MINTEKYNCNILLPLSFSIISIEFLANDRKSILFYCTSTFTKMKNRKAFPIFLFICVSLATGYGQSSGSTGSSTLLASAAHEPGPLNLENRISPQPNLYLNQDIKQEPGRCLRDAGITLTIAGVATTALGTFLMYQYYEPEIYPFGGQPDPNLPSTKKRRLKNNACIATFLLGPPLILSGGVTWIIGQRKLNRSRLHSGE